MTIKERALAVASHFYSVNTADGKRLMGKVEQHLAAVARETLDVVKDMVQSQYEGWKESGPEHAAIALSQVIRWLDKVSIQVTQGNGVREQGGLAAADGSLPGPSEAAEELGSDTPCARTVPSSATSSASKACALCHRPVVTVGQYCNEACADAARQSQTVTQIAFEILQAAKAYGLPASRWTDFDARIRAAQAPADYADARLAAQNNRVILDLLKEINALKAQLSETTRPDRNKDG